MYIEIVLIISGIVILITGYIMYDHQRIKKITLARGKANIGEYNGKPFPVQADDIFKETYHLDPDDLDDAYATVAERLGIDTGNPEKNPYWNKVTSVKNLVLFLHNQPKIQNT